MRCNRKCSIAKYHENAKVITKRDKRWDKVFTETCNTCIDGSNFYDCEIDDLFIEKRALKLRLQGAGIHGT